MTPGGLPAAERAVKRLLGGRAVRWGFAALAVGLGGYAIAKQWGDIEHALGRIGLPISIAAMIAVLGALFASMKSWQVLLAGLGSPLPVPVASRVVFLGQLGKYLPGSVCRYSRRWSSVRPTGCHVTARGARQCSSCCWRC